MSASRVRNLMLEIGRLLVERQRNGEKEKNIV